MNKILKHINEVKECGIEEMTDLLCTGKWVAISVIKFDGYTKYLVGKIN